MFASNVTINLQDVTAKFGKDFFMSSQSKYNFVEADKVADERITATCDCYGKIQGLMRLIGKQRCAGKVSLSIRGQSAEMNGSLTTFSAGAHDRVIAILREIATFAQLLLHLYGPTDTLTYTINITGAPEKMGPRQ